MYIDQDAQRVDTMSARQFKKIITKSRKTHEKSRKEGTSFRFHSQLKIEDTSKVAKKMMEKDRHISMLSSQNDYFTVIAMCLE